MVQAVNVPAALASSSDVAWLCLLRIWVGTDYANAIYVVNNSEPITSRGQKYEPFPFTVTLPADDSESLPQVTLVLSNVDRAITEFIRQSLTPPNIAVEIITSAYPDIVERSLTFLKLVSVSYDAMTISGKLDVDNFLGQKWPASTYNPVEFPGLFR